jgi:thiol-disulfide isomerase/thioredoxin/Cu/Ag efflux protein CusF
MSRPSIPAFILLAASVTFLTEAGCRSESSQEANPRSELSTEAATGADAGAEVESETHEANGTIRSITPSKTFVVIEHGTIPGFMDAMSMPFAVKDTGVVEGFAPGDSVRFTLTVQDGDVHVSRIERAVGPAGTARATSPFGVAKDFTLAQIDGNDFRLSDHHGKVVVVNFWGTWCVPCRAEIPDFIEMQEDMGDDGLLFVGIALDEESVEDVRDFVKEFGINYPVMLDEGDVADSYGGNYAVPTTFVVDRLGRIRLRAVGSIDTSTLVPVLRKLLDEPGGEA